MDVLETDDRFSMLVQAIKFANFEDTLKKGELDIYISYFNGNLTAMVVCGNRTVHYFRSDKRCIQQLIEKCPGRIIFQRQQNEILFEYAHS
jgi:hypothetical protein